MIIADRYNQILENIARTAASAGRKPEEVKLVVVTKGHPLEIAKEVVAAGALDLGENYPEKALTKIAGFSDETGVKWHMIGHVQSRKARLVCENFTLLHSLDSLKLANRLNRFCEELGRTLPALLECNVSGEASKHGFPALEESRWPELIETLAPMLELPHLEVRGLMTMAPWGQAPEQARPHFRRLRRLRDFLAQQFPQTNWDELSMGMSDDYEVAIQEGATLVRLGTAILGRRHLGTTL